MKNIFNIKTAPYLIIGALLIYIFMIRKGVSEHIKIKEKTNEFRVENPVPEVRVDTFFRDGKKKEIERIVEVANPVNKALLEDYKKAIKENDSLKALQLFSVAVTERKYKEVYKDSVQEITVESEVIGTLKSQALSYKVFEQTIQTERQNERPRIYFGGFARSGIDFTSEINYGLSLQLTNEKRSIILAVDNKKNITAGYAFKLF